MSVILTDTIEELPKTIEGFVCSSVFTAGIRVGDKGLIEERVKDAIEGVVNQSIPHRGLVNLAGLGVANLELVIAAVAVGFTF